MSTTDGTRSGGDPVLEGALAEMSSAGEFDATATFADPAPDAAPPTDASASAAPAAVPSTGSGDVGDASTTAGVAPSAGQPAAADPLAGTEPFTYGEGKTLEGVYRVPGEGLLVPEAHVASLQALAERADTLDRVHRDLTAQNETLERLTTWTGPGPDGKEQTISGQQGLEAFHVDYAQLQAEATIYRSLLNNPEQLLALMAKDESGKVLLDPAAVENWNTRIENAQIKAVQSIRGQIGQLLNPAPSPSSAPPINVEASAPKVIQQAAGSDFSLLTADDQKLLTGQLSRYVRPLTKEELPWNPGKKVGDSVVDPGFRQVVLHLASQRKAAAEQAKAAEKAGQHNAGMDKGRQPARSAPKVPAPAAKPAEPARKKADWDTPFKDAMDELAIPIR